MSSFLYIEHNKANKNEYHSFSICFVSDVNHVVAARLARMGRLIPKIRRRECGTHKSVRYTYA